MSFHIYLPNRMEEANLFNVFCFFPITIVFAFHTSFAALLIQTEQNITKPKPDVNIFFVRLTCK